MKKRLLMGVVLLLILTATPVLAVGETVSWKGIVWKAIYGSIAVSGTTGNLEVTTSSCYPPSCWGAAHYNTPGDFRAADAPWVEVTFLDSGPGTAGPQLWMEDEGGNEPSPDPSRSWTQFGAWQREGYDNYRIYWWNVHTDSNGWVDTGVARTAGQHTVTLGKQPDGTVDYWLDGALVFSTRNIAPDYFGDIYLAGHSAETSPDQTVLFTDYQTGTDYPGRRVVDDDLAECPDAMHISIQDAVDQANDGDTIEVCAGTYDETVVIDGVDVSLIAVGTVTIAPSTCLPYYKPPSHGDVIQIYDAIATIDGFTIDAKWDAGSACLGGIYVRSMGMLNEGPATALISNNTVYNYGKNGITVNGSGATGTVMSNTVLGRGPIGVPDHAQNGIQFGWEARGVARGNTTTDHYYTGSGWYATGMLLYNVYAVDVKTSQNTFRDNQRNLVVLTAQACPNIAGGVYGVSCDWY